MSRKSCELGNHSHNKPFANRYLKHAGHYLRKRFNYYSSCGVSGSYNRLVRFSSRRNIATIRKYIFYYTIPFQQSNLLRGSPKYHHGLSIFLKNGGDSNCKFCSNHYGNHTRE